MNMANHDHDHEEPEFDYQSDYTRRESKSAKPEREKRPSYARTNRPASSYNGIHRRRNKRFSW